MSTPDPSEEFWHDLAATQNNLDPDASDAWSHADSELCDESDDFTPSEDENNEIDGIFSLTSHRHGNEDSDDESQGGAAFNVQEPPSDKNFQLFPPTTEPMDIDQSDHSQPPISNSPTHPKLRSAAHDIIVNQKAVFLSLDVETGGEVAGIIQLSAEISRIEIEQHGNSCTKDIAEHIYREPNTFNMYVNPGRGVFFEESAVAVHGIHPSDPRIVNASEMRIVWMTFCDWIDSHTEDDETVILVAYNGEKCDCKWLWKLTQAPYSQYDLPTKIKWFMDPLKVISSYGSCPLNKDKSKLDSYELGVLWAYIHGKNLNGAHNSLVDAMAQTDLIISEQFVPFINRTNSIQPIQKIFGAAKQNDWKKKMEPAIEVHKPWIEQTKDSNIEWQPREEDKYTGASGGGLMGPTESVRRVARRAKYLSCMFLHILPMSFFLKVAEMTNKYAYTDRVVEKIVTDRDGKAKKRPMLVEVTDDSLESRCRAEKEKYKFRATPGFVMCWIAILILQGALFGTHKPPSRTMWENRPYGIPNPYVQNAMSGAAFEFMRRYIHFADNRYVFSCLCYLYLLSLLSLTQNILIFE